MTYGVANVKFDSGDSQKVTYAVQSQHIHMLQHLTWKLAKIIDTVLSQSVPWGKFLTAIKPSKQKSLAGLDNTTVAGMNSFKTLLMLSSKYQNGKTIQETLQKGKRYIPKTNTRCIPTALFLHLTPIIYYLLFLM